MKIAKNQGLPLVSIAARKKTSNKSLKAKNPDLYYENLYIKYYYFYQ